jgi:hypothetical protein
VHFGLVPAIGRRASRRLSPFGDEPAPEGYTPPISSGGREMVEEAGSGAQIFNAPQEPESGGGMEFRAPKLTKEKLPGGGYTITRSELTGERVSSLYSAEGEYKGYLQTGMAPAPSMSVAPSAPTMQPSMISNAPQVVETIAASAPTITPGTRTYAEMVAASGVSNYTNSGFSTGGLAMSGLSPSRSADNVAPSIVDFARAPSKYAGRDYTPGGVFKTLGHFFTGTLQPVDNWQIPTPIDVLQTGVRVVSQYVAPTIAGFGLTLATGGAAAPAAPFVSRGLASLGTAIFGKTGSGDMPEAESIPSRISGAFVSDVKSTPEMLMGMVPGLAVNKFITEPAQKAAQQANAAALNAQVRATNQSAYNQGVQQGAGMATSQIQAQLRARRF